jgi:hypothetical protein
MARVTLQLAMVAEVVIDVRVENEDAARAAALASPARHAWDEVSLAAARALRDELIDRGAASGLTIMRQAATAAPELLCRHIAGATTDGGGDAGQA